MHCARKSDSAGISFRRISAKFDPKKNTRSRQNLSSQDHEYKLLMTMFR